MSRCNASQCGAEFPIPATATLCIDGRGEVGQNLEHAVELFQSGTRPGWPVGSPWSIFATAMGICISNASRHCTMLRSHAAAQGNTDAAAELGKCYTKGVGCKANEEMGSELSSPESPLATELGCVRCTLRNARLGSAALRALRQAGQANPLKRNPDRLLRAVPALCSVLVRQGSSARPLGRLVDEPCPSRMQELVRCCRPRACAQVSGVSTCAAVLKTKMTPHTVA